MSSFPASYNSSRKSGMIIPKAEDIYACIQHASKLMANRYGVQELV
jgi:hypothetical protein